MPGQAPPPALVATDWSPCLIFPIAIQPIANTTCRAVHQGFYPDQGLRRRCAERVLEGMPLESLDFHRPPRFGLACRWARKARRSPDGPREDPEQGVMADGLGHGMVESRTRKAGLRPCRAGLVMAPSCGRGDGEGTDPGRSRPRLVHAASEPVGGRHRPDIRHHRTRCEHNRHYRTSFRSIAASPQVDLPESAMLCRIAANAIVCFPRATS